jgi:dipeptidyl aminopeptidase/acylaminoacyl peptidase
LAKTRITLDDVYRTAQVREIALSPDGTRAAFVMDAARRADDDRIPSLYVLDLESGGEPHRMTRGAFQDSHPRWSADGRYLAFLSNRPDELEVAAVNASPPDPSKKVEDHEDKDEPKAQVWVLDLRYGGEPRQLTRRKEGVDAFDWSPDGSRIVIESRDPSAEQDAYLKSIRDKKKPGPWVLTRVQHKHDGDGFLDDVPHHLFLVTVADRVETRLTAGPASETDPVWSPDGHAILFSSNRTGDADQNGRVDLWLIDPDTGAVRRLTRGDVRAGNPVFSPDGREIAFLSPRDPENAYVIEHVWTMNVQDSVPVPNLETCIGEGWSEIGGVVPDVPGPDPVQSARVYPVASERTPARILTDGIPGPAVDLRWPEAGRLLAMAGHHGQWRLLAVYPDGPFEFQAPADRIGTVTGFDARGTHAVAVIDHPQTAQEIYRIDPSGASVRMSKLHDAWLQEREAAALRWIRYHDHDGVEVEALVTTPPGFKPGEDAPAPLLVNIHGGPMAFDAPGFDFDAQYFAGLGYVVLQVNYRGSISYGEDFCRSIQGRWGPMEHDDVMCGVDEVIRLGWADPDHLYCTGFSQGGIMTNWAIGHTDRFRAAVTEHGMWNYEAAFGSDDCHSWWQDDLGVPWQNPDLYRRIAPMSGVDQIRTPVLITAGEVDWRCPLDQAEQLYIALKKRGVETSLVVYPGEHHAITRPTRAIDRLTRLQGWMGRYGGPSDPEAGDHSV